MRPLLVPQAAALKQSAAKFKYLIAPDVTHVALRSALFDPEQSRAREQWPPRLISQPSLQDTPNPPTFTICYPFKP